MDSKLLYNRKLGHWTFIWVYGKNIDHRNDIQVAEDIDVVAIDPGVRTGWSWYSPSKGCGWFGNLDINHVFHLCLLLDDFISRTSQAPARKRNSMRQAQSCMWHHIRSLIDECHKKVTWWFLANFDVVIIPPFNGSVMSRHLNRKIGCKTVRKMLTWSHSRFREHLLFKAAELDKKVVIQNEAYTSKTCSLCGDIKHNLAGSKVFRCNSCGVVMDRDLNGALGIFLRALLDGAVCMQ
jgi:putative transposase